MWREAEGYKEQVKMAWEGKDQGSPMFKITRKLRRVKTWLKELNRVGFSTIQADAYQAYQQMIKAQQQAHTFPNDVGIAEVEKEAVREYKSKQKIYDQFLQQKAKCQWIREGDSNTSLFHKSIKQRRLQNTIYAIKDCNGVLQDNPSSIAGAFLEYYQNLLGVKEEGRQRVQQEVVGLGPVIQNDQKPGLISIPTHEEIRKTMHSIKGDKAPGPDGFGSYFYQDNWDLVGGEVCEAVVSFFRTGKLLREVNTTFLSLIPKINCPGDVTEFRPIACCNTIYKCITKIICNRLKIVLPNLIAANQGAFVHQRFIVHNIMVCQDLVRKYGRKNSTPSCLIKLDLRKAYDTVEWEFVQEMLESLGFPDQFTSWVMECISTPMFSLVLNGIPHGFFKSKRGLRQGDPLSPLLFVLCMEYFSRIMTKMTEDPQFRFHPRCRGLGLTHLCFADDLIMCCRGDKYSIEKILQDFNAFSRVSGLKANNNKTEVYACGLKEEELQQIIKNSGFKRGSLPFKYLGVPTCSKKIGVGQCEKLVEAMTARIKTWSSRHLSFAGRSQLINSVLLSIHQYWAQVFVLPTKVLRDIEKVCRAYLWNGEWFSESPGYIAWQNVCRKKKSGGLGFRNIHTWNTASMAKHVWALARKQDNLWVRWIHAVYLKDNDWWEYQPPQDCSWYWKKICEVKEKLKQIFTKEDICSMEKFSIQKIYTGLEDQIEEVQWVDNVWNRFSIPKHKFCSWLAIQDRLPTAVRMHRWGPHIIRTCSLCEQGEESGSHLFFECPYSSELLLKVKQWLGISCQMNALDGLYKWITRRGKYQKAKQASYNAAITAAVYFVWYARNQVKHGKSKPQVEQLMDQLKFQVTQKLRMMNMDKLSSREKMWINQIM
ncbi:LINE-1 retrotransposable element ORF2 protein [Bienertia sinuspersici]